MRRNIFSLLARSLLPLLAATLVAGCLFHTKEEAEDGGTIGGGTLELDGFPIGADGIDPAPAADGGSSAEVEDWCELLIECVCEQLSDDAYDDCMDLAESSSDQECQALIENYYSECLEDGMS